MRSENPGLPLCSTVLLLVPRYCDPFRLEGCKNICDAAAERRFGKILFDGLAVEGELSMEERYEIGKTIAEYCRSRSMSPTVALIGNPPAVTGFGAEVALNRGLLVVKFSERQAGMDWLNGFG